MVTRRCTCLVSGYEAIIPVCVASPRAPGPTIKSDGFSSHETT